MMPDSIHRVNVIIQDIDLCIQRGGDLTDLTIDKSYCFEAVIPIWYWPFVSLLLKRLLESPNKRIVLKDLIPNDEVNDPFPNVKHFRTRVSRLKDTVAHLSRLIPDLEIRALCLHPSLGSKQFEVSKKDASYAGSYDVDKVELVHSRLAAAVIDLNQSHVDDATARTAAPAGVYGSEWLKDILAVLAVI